ncbi:NlpC/P60 family protein [Caenimonas sedimenti]|uniref:NlpC/P60 family protein n=1 Tax=Caenimonas sedimenti TaxID=2596921 RepID=A0A562ZGA1_9BURK|nr:C40 family peptidase [Caenimonas sedimenti]TWO66995.1 NlpC/P60 family protein [Caenimonas sedimenti]
MTRWLSIALLAWCAGAQAAPATSAEDDVGRFMAEKGFLDRLDQVRHSVTDRVVEQAGTVAHRASDLVVSAMGFLGVPYRRGGNSIDTGFDCSGFVKAMFEQTVGLVLPRRANEQAAATQKIERRELQPGDLVFFNTMKRTFSHVGIYVGDNKFIHSPKPGAQVRVEDMGNSYWDRRFDGARRVLTPVAAQAQAPIPVLLP